MILYTLRCSQGHEFESWFKDSKTYERQEKRALIPCPSCGDAKVARAPMAPRIGAPRIGNAGRDAPVEIEAPVEATLAPAAPAAGRQMAALAQRMPKEMRETLLKLRGQIEKNCDYVGQSFAEEARKIHYGESGKRGIYGETSDGEAEALSEEGIEFGRVPWIPRGN